MLLSASDLVALRELSSHRDLLIVCKTMRPALLHHSFAIMFRVFLAWAAIFKDRVKIHPHHLIR